MRTPTNKSVAQAIYGEEAKFTPRAPPRELDFATPHNKINARKHIIHKMEVLEKTPSRIAKKSVKTNPKTTTNDASKSSAPTIDVSTSSLTTIHVKKSSATATTANVTKESATIAASKGSTSSIAPCNNFTTIASAPKHPTACARSSSSAQKTVFEDKYRLQNYLSKAVNGGIYICVPNSSRDSSTKSFACKVISNSIVKDRRRKHQICDDPTREFKMLRLLTNRPHRNLLSLVDQFEDETNTYFVMPLAHGGDLLSSVECHATTGLGDKITREILQQMVLALQHLHGMGWQHGDVSLENILVMSPGDFGSVKLCDFGLANRLGIPGRRAGKPMYMAPEVIATPNGKAPAATRFVTSAAQDVFSLGVTMFMAMFGFPPFDRAVGTDRNYRDIQGNKEAYRRKLTQWGVSAAKTRLPLVSLLMDMMHADADKRPTLTDILHRLNKVESSSVDM